MTDVRPLLDWREQVDKTWHGMRGIVPLAVAWEGHAGWWWSVPLGGYNDTPLDTRAAAQAAAEQAVRDWFQRVGARLEDG